MAAEFEFRLIGASAPRGELPADDLIALAQSVKEVATKLSRHETRAELTGRPGKRTKNIADVAIGLAPGSTRLIVHRLTTAGDALDFDLEEERAFDERFAAIVASVADDRRPEWVSSTVAVAAGKLRTALAEAATSVEFSVDGVVQATFVTASTHRETWQAVDIEEQAVTFVGRLRAVNLDSHRLQVTDDAGHKVALIDVEDDAEAGRLLNQYVVVVGFPERDAKERISHLHSAQISVAETVPGGVGGGESVPLADILASAPGPEPGGITDLTDDEIRSFLEAIRR